MHRTRVEKVQSFIQVLLFVFSILFCPLTSLALDSGESSKLPSEESTAQSAKQFKKAVTLLNLGMYKEAENILLKFKNIDSWQDKAVFLLGKLYKEEGSLEKAQNYLRKSANSYPLLKNYALKLLTDVYIAKEEFDKAIETARQIKNRALLQEVKQSEIISLLALEKEEAAIKVLYKYVDDYPLEWDLKFLLSRLLKNTGKRDESTNLLKDIYINAAPLAEDAFIELQSMNADIFTSEEILKRAEKLYEKDDFEGAEATYKKALQDIDDSAMKDKVRFTISMCQFKQKKYNLAVKGLDLVGSPKAMYWMARVFYRIDDLDGFKRTIKEIEKDYPKNQYLAELLLILADDLRRAGKLSEAEEVFNKVLRDFPEKAEEVFWGIGWMNYTNGDYEKAAKYFSKLTSSVKNIEPDKYLYWEAKSREMVAKDCMEEKANIGAQDSVCPEQNNNAYSKLSGDSSYYAFLARMRSRGLKPQDRVEIARLKIPKGEVYERIETLVFLGMNKEAVEEIKIALKFTKKPEEFKYLAFTAIDAGEYKSIIYYVEETKDREFLRLAYPLGFWDIIKEVAEKESVDPYLIAAIIREESRFDPEAVSSAGAIGLMQLMPFTARRINKELKIELNGDLDLYDTRKNILIGTHYLSLLIGEFEEIPLAIAAYNAGENALKKWLFDSNHKDIEEFIEDIPYDETRRYVKKVLRSYWQYRTIEGLPLRREEG